METRHFESILGAEEKVIWSHRPSLIKYLISYRELWYGLAFSLLFLVCWFVLEMVSPDRWLSWKMYLLFPLAIGLVTAASITWRLLNHVNLGYGLTNRHVFLRQGVVSISYRAISLHQIRKVEVQQDIAQRVLGTGCIRFFTNQSTGDAFGLPSESVDQWESVEAPYEVYRKIVQLNPTCGG